MSFKIGIIALVRCSLLAIWLSLSELIIKGKNDFFRINKDLCYVFYNETKTKKEKENQNMRNLLENLINNKIKIKKIND